MQQEKRYYFQKYMIEMLRFVFFSPKHFSEEQRYFKPCIWLQSILLLIYFEIHGFANIHLKCVFMNCIDFNSPVFKKQTK